MMWVKPSNKPSPYGPGMFIGWYVYHAQMGGLWFYATLPKFGKSSMWKMFSNSDWETFKIVMKIGPWRAPFAKSTNSRRFCIGTNHWDMGCSLQRSPPSMKYNRPIGIGMSTIHMTHITLTHTHSKISLSQQENVVFGMAMWPTIMAESCPLPPVLSRRCAFSLLHSDGFSWDPTSKIGCLNLDD